MSTNTYVALKTTTVTGSPAASVTLDLTGISGYTDIVIVSSVKLSSSSSNLYMQVGNGSVDTGTNYSNTLLAGDGSSASSYRNSNTNQYTIGEITATNFDTVITNVMNYANTTTYKTVLNRSSAASYKVDAWVGLWRSTSAINTIKLFNDTQTFAVGSTFTAYGIANADVGAYATGGIITQDANYYYHAFGSSSTFTPTRNLTADILVVAGGGGGGANTSGGGGGGAGGLLYFASQSLTNGTGYSCTIGAGGAGATSSATNGTVGVDSQFAALTLVKGGGYGSGNSTGGTGGSGGGAGRSAGASGGSATSGQGYAGGAAYNDSANQAGGGGGGAGSAGSISGAASTGGAGGNGVSTYDSILSATGLGVLNASDNLRYIAGGGGGAGYYNTTPGTTSNVGIGGKGGGGTMAAGTIYTGSGGAGGGGSSGGGGYTNGYAGGSGLIIVRYSK